MNRPSEGVETLVYAVSREALEAELDEWGEYNDWESWKGKLEDISHSPLLLERLIKGDKNLRYDAGRKRLTVKEDTSGKTWLALNELLIKPLFEVRELSVDEVMETEKQLLAEAGY